MPFKKKRKAAAVEPAVADPSPPAKRGRPAKAQDAAVSPAPALETPHRGRPKKAQQEQIVTSSTRTTPTRNKPASQLTGAQTAQPVSKKVKHNTSASRSSQRISNASEAASGSRTTRRSEKAALNGVVNENANGSVAAVKYTKAKVKGKTKAATKKKPVDESTEVIPISSLKGAGKKKTDVPGNSNVSVNIPTPEDGPSDEEKGDDEAEDEGPNYWLMKAEPDSRIEKGKDVKFSIDDLRFAAEPEGWDGVRNATARNNMRMMLKGDLAFFYHSNCKVPGIAGIMEIVQEHTPDESALDASHPYYDPKSTAENPKWCKVHVAFRQKFSKLIKLKELQKFAKDGGVLQNMQTLRQSRLSVSKVTKKEWHFIMDLVEEVEEDLSRPVPEAPMIANETTVNENNAEKSGVTADPAFRNGYDGASETEIVNSNGLDTDINHQSQDAAERLRERADPLEHFHGNAIENTLATMLPASFAPI